MFYCTEACHWLSAILDKAWGKRKQGVNANPSFLFEDNISVEA